MSDPRMQRRLYLIAAICFAISAVISVIRLPSEGGAENVVLAVVFALLVVWAIRSRHKLRDNAAS